MYIDLLTFWAQTAYLSVCQGHGSACPLFSSSHGIPHAFCHLAHAYEVGFQSLFHVLKRAPTPFKDKIYAGLNILIII